jgi:hypothetical protein
MTNRPIKFDPCDRNFARAHQGRQTRSLRPWFALTTLLTKKRLFLSEKAREATHCLCYPGTSVLPRAP